MKPSIFWKLMVLVRQTGQYAVESTNFAFNNFTTPQFFELNHTLRREKREDTKIAKHTVAIMKNTRYDNYRYLVDFNMGNPPQRISAELSLKYRGLYIVSETRLSYSITDYVMSIWHPRPRDGVLTPSKSQSYKVHTSAVFVTQSDFYGTAWASYAHDDLYIGINLIEEGRFMVMHETEEPSMIGLGLSEASEFVSDEHSMEESTNIFNQMKKRGWTLRAAFSIWIGSESSSVSGMILFNAVNYRYALTDTYVFPLIPVKNKKGYYIRLNGINIVGLDNRTTEVVHLSVPMEIDFEMPYSTFPLEITKLFYSTYNRDNRHIFKVSCETESKKGAIGLVFSGVQYNFPFIDVLPDCQNGQSESDPPFYPGYKVILGANFLSTLFMVFDLDRREVGIAIANTEVEHTMIDNQPFLDTISGIKAPSFSKSRVINTVSIVGSYYSTMASVVTVSRGKTRN